MSEPPKAVTRLVDRRDQECCVRCGISLHLVAGSRHHRQRRAVGGHTCSNIILLCGSGTTGCHGWVHGNPEEARSFGWIVPANGIAEPHAVPVFYRVLKQWRRLNDVGGFDPLDPALARSLLPEVKR